MKKRAFEVTEDQLQDRFVVSEDEVEQDMILVDDQDEDEVQEIQVGSWSDANSFVKYCTALVQKGPEIKADNKSSLIRAAQYFDNLETEIVEGVSADADSGDLSMSQLETLDVILDRIDVTKQELAKASGRVGILKQAAKAARFTYVVDPFLFAVARLIVNAKVANGKNIEDTFNKIASQYKIDDRETLALRQIIRDMGYPIHGSFVADEGSYDMITQYFA